MSVEGNNATAPSPAVAPGGEAIEPVAAARDLARRWPGGIDPRVPAIVPAFDAPFFQAGLAGYSDAAMRIVARRHGCPFCVTEALLDRTLLAGGRGFNKADLGALHDNIPGGAEDHPLACQIMGSDPAEMAAACLKVAEQGLRHDKVYRQLAYDHLSPDERSEVFDTHLRAPGGVQVGRIAADPREETCETLIDEVNAVDPALHPDTRSPRHPASPRALSFETIDINLACPVKKIKSKARGGHWLAEPDGAIAILRAVREAVPAGVVCTVKLRRGFDDTAEMAANFDRILDAAFALGYSWATVHARTVEQKYIGPSRWDILRQIVRRNPDKLIFGSGDVWEVGEIFRMLSYTGVAAVAVARGCIGNPWIFRQARQMLRGEPPAAPTLAEQRAVLEEHFRLSVALNGEHHAGRLMRKFGIRFAAHHPAAEDVRRRFISVGSLAQWREVLERHYPTPG
ncbi:MAG: tRNA-dihydrouridine synthase family protein [Phycisphaerales bacterium]|nr:tRNA-dihydrouridine synthase family protein [Phycisphaerales bacterium]